MKPADYATHQAEHAAELARIREAAERAQPGRELSPHGARRARRRPMRAAAASPPRTSRADSREVDPLHE